MACKCTTCDMEYDDQDDFRAHCKELWHTYNLKRKVAGLGPITKAVWEEKVAAKDQAEAAPTKGSKHKTAPKERTAPKPKEPEVPWTPERCLFDNTVSASPEENVLYMGSKYSFFVPDREYLVKPVELLVMLREKIHDDSTCIFCNKIFGSEQSVLKHMFDLNHTRIGTDTNILCGELGPFYDFSNSKSELVRPGLRKKKKEGEPAASDSEEAAEENARASGEEGGEWEDCSDAGSDDSDALEVVECEDVDEFEAVLAEYGLQRTEVLPCGDLRLPSGAVATHRRYAYVYKQRFRPAAERDAVQKRLALSLSGTAWGMKALTAGGIGGGAGRGLHGAQAVAVGSRLIKTHRRQVVAILKHQQTAAMKLGVHHNNSNMKKFQKKVQVSLYSWAK